MRYLQWLLLLVKCISETALCGNGREKSEDERWFIWSHMDKAGETPLLHVSIMPKLKILQFVLRYSVTR